VSDNTSVDGESNPAVVVSGTVSNNMVLDVLMKGMVELRYGHIHGKPKPRFSLFATLRGLCEVCERTGDRDLVSETRRLLRDALVVLDAAATCAKSDIESGAAEGGVA